MRNRISPNLCMSSRDSGTSASQGIHQATHDMPAIRPLSPVAVDAKRLAALLNVSVRTIRTLDAAGKLPRPVKIGGRSVRWVASEIEAWLAAGAPDRRTWETLRSERHG